MTTDNVQAVAARVGELTEFGVSLVLARSETISARALGAVVQVSRSDTAAKAALGIIGLLHRAAPAASRAAGQVVGMSVLVAGRAAQTAAHFARSGVAAVSRGIRG
jgi:hypothetical protein